MTWYINFLAWKQIIISLYHFNYMIFNVIHPWPLGPVPLKINLMTFSKSHDIKVMTLVFRPTKQISWHSASGDADKCLTDSHLPFVYNVILSIFPIWRIGDLTAQPKKTSKFFKMAAPRPAHGHWAGSTLEDLPVCDGRNMFNIS